MVAEGAFRLHTMFQIGRDLGNIVIKIVVFSGACKVLRLYPIDFSLAHVCSALSGLPRAWLSLGSSIVAQIDTLVQNVYCAVVEAVSGVSIIAYSPLTFLETSRA